MVTVPPLNSVLDRMVTLNRAMDHAFSAGTVDALGNSNAQPSWVPDLDAWETESGYVVQLDLPGVSADQVDVNFERNTLSVRGVRARPIQAPEKGELKVFFAERDWGSFARSLRFPQHVVGDKIDASFADGVLTITIPKSESAKPRKIVINTVGETRKIEQ